VQLLHAQCKPRDVEWDEHAEFPQEGTENVSGLQLLARVEGWNSSVPLPSSLLAGASWLWAVEIPSAATGLCFAAWRSATTEARCRRESLCSDAGELGSELPIVRQGAEVISGVDALVRLTELWGRPELAGGDTPRAAAVAATRSSVAATLETLEKLRQVLLRGMILPQAHLNAKQQESSTDDALDDEAEVYQGVQLARAEARYLLLQLDTQLGTAKRGFFTAGRLTVADLYAVAVLDGVASLVSSDWMDYPLLRSFVQRMRTLPGFEDAGKARAGLLATMERTLSVGSPPVTI